MFYLDQLNMQSNICIVIIIIIIMTDRVCVCVSVCLSICLSVTPSGAFYDARTRPLTPLLAAMCHDRVTPCPYREFC